MNLIVCDVPEFQVRFGSFNRCRIRDSDQCASACNFSVVFHRWKYVAANIFEVLLLGIGVQSLILVCLLDT